MLDFTTGELLTGLVVSSIGLFFFMWGKSTGRMIHLGIGVALMALPMFVGNQVIVWSLTAAALIPAWTFRHA